MISALLFTSHCWRRVSPWRLAGAVLVLVAGDLLIGVVVAALLGGNQWGRAA